MALKYACEHQSEFEGVIGSAPALRPKIKPSFIERIILQYIATWIPNVRWPLSLDVKFISHDADTIEKYKNDPLIHNLGTFGLCKNL